MGEQFEKVRKIGFLGKLIFQRGASLEGKVFARAAVPEKKYIVIYIYT